MSSTRGGEGQAALSAEELALETLPLMHAVVEDVAASAPSTVDQPALVSAALVALVEAARAFEPRHDGPFEAYATACLRVALMEVLRAAPAAARPCDTADHVQLSMLHATLEEMPEPVAEPGTDEGVLVQERTEALMQLRAALRRGELDQDASAPAVTAYAAVLSRRALLRASARPDVRMLPRGA